MSTMMRFYHRLPAQIRPLVASSYGHMLRKLRYGGATDRLVEAALERETWSSDQWQRWQQERLAEVLDSAAKHVPFYREHWQRRRSQGDRAPWDELQNWPVLRKESLRGAPEAFLRGGRPGWGMHAVRTSGSTGTPLRLWRSRHGMQQWYALMEARWRRWYGVSRHDRWAMLGGKMVIPFAQEAPPYWVWNGGLNQLYMSIFHLKPTNVGAYLDAMRSYRVKYLYGYASSMAVLAQLAIDQELPPLRLQVAVSNAEPLQPYQRDAIERFFGCSVRDTYGMTEGVAAASECEHGSMHVWPEVGMLEVLGDEIDDPLPVGEEGRLVFTGLLEKRMPLIRYEVGDRGASSQELETCGCGRTLPRLKNVVGRLTDNVVTGDGRRVYQVGSVFFGVRVREAQIIQEKVDWFRIRLVPDIGYGQDDSALLKKKLRERIGDVSVDVELVDTIPRSKNGKFRQVINNIDSGRPAS